MKKIKYVLSRILLSPLLLLCAIVDSAGSWDEFKRSVWYYFTQDE